MKWILLECGGLTPLSECGRLDAAFGVRRLDAAFGVRRLDAAFGVRRLDAAFSSRLLFVVTQKRRQAGALQIRPLAPTHRFVLLFLRMDPDVIKFGLAAFVTLLVVVDPPGVVPIYVALTKGQTPSRRRRILTRAVLIAFGSALFFLVAGRAVLSYLGVTVHAFSISGGILLFVAAMPMLFGQRGGLQSPEPKERGDLNTDETGSHAETQDISVFPLAMPLLSGPGTIATILLLTSQAGGDMQRLTAIGVAIAVVFLVSFVVLYLGGRVIALVGEGGVDIATRVMGIVLAALAVQYVLNGITGYYHLLLGR